MSFAQELADTSIKRAKAIQDFKMKKMREFEVEKTKREDELMKKLNYMIHLLEENKDEKTNNVTEELVLYLFLGVFTIFVVDSFARAGKYTR